MDSNIAHKQQNQVTLSMTMPAPSADALRGTAQRIGDTWYRILEIRHKNVSIAGYGVARGSKGIAVVVTPEEARAINEPINSIRRSYGGEEIGSAAGYQHNLRVIA